MNRTMTGKVFSLALAAALLAFFCLASEVKAQSEPNIGVFDLQKVLNDSKKGKNAKDGLKAKFDKMKKDLESKENELSKLRGDLEKQAKAKSLSQEKLAQKSEELSVKIRDFQTQLKKYDEDMQKAESDALNPLIDKIVKKAAEIGKARGYILVLETQNSGAVYYLDSIDLTNEVLKAIDK